jgi:hypothetical protein
MCCKLRGNLIIYHAIITDLFLHRCENDEEYPMMNIQPVDKTHRPTVDSTDSG